MRERERKGGKEGGKEGGRKARRKGGKGRERKKDKSDIINTENLFCFK